MTNFAKLIRSQSARSQFDGLFSQWGAIGSGLAFFVFTVATLPKVANSRGELVLGIGAALVTFLVTVIFGVLARQAHEAVLRGELRTRSWEYSAIRPVSPCSSWAFGNSRISESVKRECSLPCSCS